MKTMATPYRRSLTTRTLCLLVWLGLSVVAGGEGVAQSPATSPAGTTPPAHLDACSLLTQAEVERLTGRQVQAPVKENEVANLATCYYGSPESPIVNNRPFDSVVKVGVMMGIEGQYYAGPVAQARDTYEMARKNASPAQAVNGLGEDAYWDESFDTLNVLQGRYMVGITVAAEGGDQVAQEIAKLILPKLP